MKRRQWLASMGTVLSGSVVGCVSNSDDTQQPPNESDTNDGTTTADEDEDETELTGHIRPDGEPETVPTDLTCPDESFTRFPTRYDEVRWGDTDKLSFRVNDDAIEHGDTVRATLRSTDYVSMGTEQQVQVELYTEEGWKEVRGRSAKGSSSSLTSEPNSRRMRSSSGSFRSPKRGSSTSFIRSSTSRFAPTSRLVAIGSFFRDTNPPPQLRLTSGGECPKPRLRRPGGRLTEEQGGSQRVQSWEESDFSSRTSRVAIEFHSVTRSSTWRSPFCQRMYASSTTPPITANTARASPSSPIQNAGPTTLSASSSGVRCENPYHRPELVRIEQRQGITATKSACVLVSGERIRGYTIKRTCWF